MPIFTRLVLTASLICSPTILAIGRDDSSQQQRELWRTRADAITSRLLKEASNLDSLDGALLLVQLSDAWWEVDKNQANAWVEKAVDAIASYPSEEVKANSEKFFQTARQVLLVISNRNRKQSGRLVEILSEADKFADKEKDVNADSLIEFALQIVKENPAQAAQTGTLAFRVGQPKEFYRLSWELRRYNPALADQFFRTALSSATASRSPEALQRMLVAAFPENFVTNFPPNLAPPKALRTEFLSFLADHIAQQQYNFVHKSIQSCAGDARIVSRVKNHFADLLPQRSGTVQQAIDVCTAGQNPRPAQTQTQPASLKTSNPDELLKLADEVEGDPNVRGAYLFRAALAANQQKKYALSIKILEGMSEKEREPFADDWEELRHDSAGGLAYAQYKDGDLAGALATLQSVPDKLRPLAQVGFMLSTSPEDASTYSFGVEQLNNARRGLLKSELPFAKKASYWLNLVKLYSNYKLQTDAAEVFREIAASFNGALSDDKAAANSVASDQLIADAKRVIPTLSPTFLEGHENSLLESVGSLKQARPRAQINLAFLKLALKQYRLFDAEFRKKSDEKPNRGVAASRRKEG